jgi:hypothetical protein
MSLELNIRAFRAMDDPASRDEYHIGLEQVLLYYGVTKVTSQTRDWFMDPNTWLVVVESREDGQILGGARMQMSGIDLPLPMEKAIGFKDPRIYDIINSYRENGVGEFCGLWNSRKVAGMGLGSMYLGTACIAIAPKIRMGTVLGLCAPSTKRNSFRLGFRVDTRLGMDGEFNYPKESLVATALIIDDPVNLPDAEDEDRNEIITLRENPNLVSHEITPRGNLTLHYLL